MDIIFVTGPMAARAEGPYSFAAPFIMDMERLVSSWNTRVGIPIFRISDMISPEKQQS